MFPVLSEGTVRAPRAAGREVGRKPRRSYDGAENPLKFVRIFSPLQTLRFDAAAMRLLCISDRKGKNTKELAFKCGF